MKFEKNEVIKMVKIAVCLLLITAISTLLVAAVNEITKAPIEEQRTMKVNEAMNEILPAERYEPVEIESLGLEDIVKEVNVAYDKDNNVLGYCVKTVPAGYGGDIEIMTGIDTEGLVTGVNIVNMSETAGLGTKTQEPSWLAQFKGKGSDVAVTTGIEPMENEVSAVSGATVSSKAVTKGVAAAINAANQVKGAAEAESGAEAATAPEAAQTPDENQAKGAE